MVDWMRGWLLGPLAGGVLAVAVGSVSARDLYVDPEKGSEKANGLAAEPGPAGGPVKTIQRALRLAGPGDSVHLNPTRSPYREVAIFHNRHGEPGRPITLDGHGATLEGSDPLILSDWKQIGPGLYQNDHLLSPRLYEPANLDAVLQRYFFLMDGKMNHMGRTSKGPRPPLKKVADLRPGEWTFEKESHSFFIQIDPAKTLADYRIAAPVRSAGVAISGDCAHLVIRNVRSVHPYNDGYNIHGKTRQVHFQDIEAHECGDDGFSAHDDCAVSVDGFLSVGNSTGIANVGASTSTNNRVIIKDCLGIDLLLMGSNRHTLTNSIVYCTGSQSVVVSGGKGADEVCTLRMKNVVLKRVAKSPPMRFDRNSVVELEQATMDSLGIRAGGQSLTLRNCVLGGESLVDLVVLAGTQWHASQNAYALRRILIDQTVYTANDLARYREATGQDRTTSWGKIVFQTPFTGAVAEPALPAGVGADVAKIQRK